MRRQCTVTRVLDFDCAALGTGAIYDGPARGGFRILFSVYDYFVAWLLNFSVFVKAPARQVSIYRGPLVTKVDINHPSRARTQGIAGCHIVNLVILSSEAELAVGRSLERARDNVVNVKPSEWNFKHARLVRY